MEVPRLGVEWELQLPAYTRATATPDPSCIYDLRHSSGQQGILNPLSEARDQPRTFIDTHQVCYCWAMAETPTKDTSESLHFKWKNKLGGDFSEIKVFIKFSEVLKIKTPITAAIQINFG